jgi:polyhydroxybutyrate depolymerase
MEAKTGIEMLPDKDKGDKCSVEKVTYVEEGNPCEVILYTIRGGGHNLPGGNTPDRPRIVGRKCMDINAAEIIWEFFKKHK